ncbi:hypothetical protein D3218_06075 [Aureimonas flava]|uniref:Flagellin n=1 Tax=Aureimonas flava TaxID=2320271 RepID=A0A3A1WM09_9HYPH|nr:flagellin [Aureimonas flava]RIY01891.1 hypothetical protein D3218_06075 [Aureimonas flava]
MVSINTSANAAVLASIRQINSDLATTQLRIGTGKKVNSASDNSSVWSIAQAIQSQQSQQDALSSAISVTKSQVDTAVTALDTVAKLLNEAKTLADSGTNASSDYTALMGKIDAINAQIKATVDSASLKGKNWLTDANGVSVTLGYKADGTTANTVSATTKDLYAAAGTGELTDYVGTADATDAATAATYSAAVTTALNAVTQYQASLSSFSSSLGIQQDFMKALSSIRSDAVSQLVDADLTEENAKITALQTQQALAYQALSIGNSSSQNILRLFQ